MARLSSQGRLLSGGLVSAATSPGAAQYVGPIIAATCAHPSVERVANTWYMVLNDNGVSGVYLRTSTDGVTWSAPVQIISPAAGGGYTEAPDLKRVGGTWVIYAMCSTNGVAWHVGAFTNTGDIADPGQWSAETIVIPDYDLGGNMVLDPQFLYFPNGFDTGAGYGTHPYWLIVGKAVTSGDNVQEQYLYRSDNLTIGWTKANGGAPVNTVSAPNDLFPGDLVRLGNRIWWLDSYHDQASNRGYMRWYSSNDLVHWTLQGTALEPESFGSYVWAIEGDLTVVGEELWGYIGLSVAGIGWKDAIGLVKFRAAGAVEL